ncbi:MAG: S-layer homology domain-containing protein [Smithellaceae bacterium]
MLSPIRISKMLVLFIFFACVLLLVSCAPKERVATSQLDTPEHHTYTGLKLIDQEKYADAQGEFELAIQLDTKYSKAYTGTALVKIYTANFDAAWDNLKTGWKYTKTDEERLFVYVSRIQYYTQSKSEKKWLALAKDDFDEAVKLDPKHSPAYYFMGLAYKAGLNFNSAGQMFTKVLELKSGYVDEADVQWKFLQKVQRAMPGTATGKQIALVERLTRADAAALFMEELKIDVLYKKRTPKTFDTSFKNPEKTAAKTAKITANDIADHPLKVDIEGILEIGVRGLENYPDGNFHPGELVTRAAFAMMLEDILIKVTGDNSLATKFIGSISSFPDLKADLPYFNAIMVVTSRGIMEAKDMTSGEFAPLSPVAGVDALLIIRKIKEELKFN